MSNEDIDGSKRNTELSSQDLLLEAIDSKIGEVRTEAVDLSFGEIINLISSEEVLIDPDYQRLFRWSEEQKSRLVESVLLRLPIPPIFFYRERGWEIRTHRWFATGQLNGPIHSRRRYR